MPTANKVLIPIIIVVSLAFIWLSTAVLQTRHNWDKKINDSKEGIRPQVAKVAEEIDLLLHGDESAREAFKEFVKTDIRPIASAEFGKVLDDRLSKGVDIIPAFVVAMDSFVDPKVVENYRLAVEKLNELQKTPVVEETQLTPLLRDYDTAERELEQQLKNLEDAYARFLGEVQTQSGGIRAIADRRVEGVYRGLGIDSLRSTLVRVGEIIVQHRALYATMLSDGAKNETLLRDMAASTADRATQTQKAATEAEKERDERQRELEEINADYARAKIAKAEAERIRDKWIADLAALQKLFDTTQAKCVELWRFVRKREIELDQQRGIRTVVNTPDGVGTTGKVQSVDEKTGMIRVNLGREHGVRNGAHLQVFQTSPKLKYLGILEVSETDTDASSGQMLKEYGQVAIKVGDSVATHILPKSEQR